MAAFAMILAVAVDAPDGSGTPRNEKSIVAGPACPHGSSTDAGVVVNGLAMILDLAGEEMSPAWTLLTPRSGGRIGMYSGAVLRQQRFRSPRPGYGRGVVDVRR